MKRTVNDRLIELVDGKVFADFDSEYALDHEDETIAISFGKMIARFTNGNESQLNSIIKQSQKAFSDMWLAEKETTQ